jgi:MFS family permease
VLAERHLHAAGRFGLLLGAIGLGAGFGPLALQWFVQDVRRTGWLFGPCLLRGLVDLTLAATSSFGVAVGALVVYGAGTGTVTYNSVLQTGVPDRIRGRVFAFYAVVWQTTRLASIGLGGVLADAYWINGGVCHRRRPVPHHRWSWHQPRRTATQTSIRRHEPTQSLNRIWRPESGRIERFIESLDSSFAMVSCVVLVDEPRSGALSPG